MRSGSDSAFKRHFLRLLRLFGFRNLRAAVAATLAMVLLSETAFAYKPQANLWDERGHRRPVHLASANMGLPIAPAATAQLNRLLSTLPAASLPKPAAAASAATALPAEFLSNVNIKRTIGTDAPNAVILLEDVHHNGEAQKHLSLALQSLGAQPGDRPVSVSLEGASGAFRFSSFHRFPDAALAASVADAFLDSGDIGGPSHAGFVSRPVAGRRGLAFIGADDAANYRKNVAAYRESSQIRIRTRAAVASLRQDLARRASQEFSPRLAAFNALAERHHAGELALAGYAAALATSVDAPVAVQRFVEAYGLESRLNLAQVDAERRRVLEKLVSRLSPADMSGLVAMSLGYRDGTVSFGGYYDALRGLCARNGVDLRSTPAFDEYVRYVLLADGIDADALFAGIEAMESEAYARLSSTPEETALVAAIRQSRLAERLVEFGLTSQQWDAYKAHRPFGHGINLSSFETFYDAAEARDAAMAASIPATGASALVAGGFHSDGVAAELRRRGRTVIVCTPKMSKADPASASAYLSVFDRERAPLERIFAGEKLFLASLPAGAARSLVSGIDSTSELAHVTEALTRAETDDRSAAAAARLAAAGLGDTAAPVSIDRVGDEVTLVSRSGSGEVATVVRPAGTAAPRKPFWARVNDRVVGKFAVAMYSRSSAFSRRARFAVVLLVAVFVPASIALLFYGQAARRNELAAISVASAPEDPRHDRVADKNRREDEKRAGAGRTLGTFGALSGLLGVLGLTGNSSDGPDRARNLQELQTNDNGMQAWIENVGKQALAPDANLIELAADLSGDRGDDARNAARELLMRGELARLGARGVRGVSVTVRGLTADILDGAFNEEIGTLVAQNVTDPVQIFIRLERAVAVAARATLDEHGVGSQVVVEPDMDAVVRAGAHAEVLAEINDITAHLVGATPRVPAYLSGRVGFERRGAVHDMIRDAVRENGVVPQVSLDFGPHTYVLTVKAFVRGARLRLHDLLDRGATPEQLRAEVARLSQSLNAISVDEIDREPEIGVDALIDLAIQTYTSDETKLRNAVSATSSDMGKALGEEADAAAQHAADLAALKGKAGIATAKVVHQIYLHIFYGTPLPEDELEAIYGDWMVADIREARGDVSQIRQDTGASLEQRFMVAAPDLEAANGAASVRSAGLAGGWVAGRRGQTHAYTAGELAEFESFLSETGLPRQENVTAAVPLADSSSDDAQRRAYARTLADIPTEANLSAPATILRRINTEVFDFLNRRHQLPAELQQAASDHSRGNVSISDLSEALQVRTAERMAAERRDAVAAVSTQMNSRPAGSESASNRSIQNRVGMGLFFLGVLLSSLALAYFGLQATSSNLGLLIVAVAGVIISPAFTILFFVQSIQLSRGYRRRNATFELIPEFHDLELLPDPSGPATSVIHNRIRLNTYLFDTRRNRSRLPVSVQRSILAEERRHIRYRLARGYRTDEPRSMLSLSTEELWVNTVMPIVDFFRRQADTHPAAIHREVPAMDLALREELSRLRNLVERLKSYRGGKEQDFEEIIFISDQHGTIDVFDALLLDAILGVQPIPGVTRLDPSRAWTAEEFNATVALALRREFPGRVPTDFVLAPDRTLPDVLKEFNIDPDEARARVLFHNPMGLANEGKFGPAVARRAKELSELGWEFKLDPDKTLDEQLVPLGVSLEGLKGKIFFHNLGDFKDRGPYGIKILNRSRELIDAGLSDFIVGNHDLWTMMNLLGLHIPWYRGFQFYGYKDSYDAEHGNIADVVARYHDSNPGTLDRTWWAEKLAEYEAYQAVQQKDLWSGSADKLINGDYDKVKKKYVKGTGIYSQVAPTLSAEHKKLWEKLKGFYLVDIQTGTRAVGQSSIKWWEELLADFHKAYAEVRMADRGQRRPAHVAWEQAINLMENEIIPTLRTDLEQHLAPTEQYPNGQWWWRAFEAINYRNYTSPEWWAKDWVFHEGWGPTVLKELNEIKVAKTGAGAEKVTPSNYLDDPVIQAAANFYKSHFTLFGRDDHQNTYMHAFLPVDMEGDGGKRVAGEFTFGVDEEGRPRTYKGVEYRGNGSDQFPSVWEGLERIQHDIRNGRSLAEINEALDLVNSWYADNTTKIKPPNVVAAINKFGADELARLNGFNRLYTGHIPFHEFSKIDPEMLGPVNGFQTGGRIIFTDQGMGVRFGSRGGYVVSSVKRGLFLQGREMEGDQAIVRNPRTMKPIETAAGPSEQVLFENPGIDKITYLNTVISDVERRIDEIQAQFAQAARSFANRVLLTLPFLLAQSALLTIVVAFNVPLDRLVVIGFVVIANAIPAVLMLQGAEIILAHRRDRSGRAGYVIPEAMLFPDVRLPVGIVGAVLGGRVVLDHTAIAQMSARAQRSVIREELRHLRYQREHALIGVVRSPWSIFLEEFIVNIIRPVVELFRPDPEVRAVGRPFSEARDVAAVRAGSLTLSRTLSGLTPSTELLQGLVGNFMGEMQRGMAGDPQSLEMIRTEARFPTGQEQQYIVALDWGGSTARLALWELQGGGRVRKVQTLPDYLFSAADKKNPRALYPMLAGRINQLIGLQPEADQQKKFTVVVGFAFPPSQWSKGWSDPNGLKPITQEEHQTYFNAEFVRRGEKNLSAEKGENDTLDPMMIETYERRAENSLAPAATVSVILGTGHNIAAEVGGVIWNFESGAYDGVRVIETEMDRMTDRNQGNPGQHLLEKMVAGGYLGEVLRNSLTLMRQDEGLFAWNAEAFTRPNALPSTFVSDIAATRGDATAIARVLQNAGVRTSTWKERVALYALAEAVLDRSARVTAIELAATLRVQNPALDRPTFIPIEGSVFEKAPRYPERLQAALVELIGDDAASLVHLIPNRGRAGSGTAVLAATAGSPIPLDFGTPITGDQSDVLQVRASDGIRDELSPWTFTPAEETGERAFDQVFGRRDGSLVIHRRAIAQVVDRADITVRGIGDAMRIGDVLSAQGFHNVTLEAGAEKSATPARAAYSWGFRDPGGEVNGSATLALENGVWTVAVRTSVPQLTNDILSHLVGMLTMSGLAEPGFDAGAPRSLGNRLALAATFFVPALLGLIGFVLAGVDPFQGWSLLVAVPLAVFALGALPFLWQAFWIVAATLHWSRLRGAASGTGMPYYVDTLGRWTAAFSLYGSIFVNRHSFLRLPHAQQRSAIREERRHVRYWADREPRLDRWGLRAAWEEYYVNVIMPVLDLFDRNTKNGERVIPVAFAPEETLVVDVRVTERNLNGKPRRYPPDINLNADLVGAIGLTLFILGIGFGAVIFAGSLTAWSGLAIYRRLAPFWVARRWVSEAKAYASASNTPATSSNALVDALDAAAPKGVLFGNRSADDLRSATLTGFAAQAAKETSLARRLLQWATLAGYRRAVAAHGGASAGARLAQVENAGAKTRVVVYHVNQLGSESVVASELAELQTIIDRAARESAAGEQVAVVAAVSAGLSDSNAAALARIIAAARGGAVQIGVSDDLRSADGESYSYEKLLAKAAVGSRLEALDALVKGNYDDAAFVTFSKIPAQFLADGKLRAVWTLLANIGAGWAPLPVDTMIRAAILARQSA